MKTLTIKFEDKEGGLKILAEIDQGRILEDISRFDIIRHCQENDIDIETEVEVEIEIPEIEPPLSGPPQNLHEELCIKFDLPRMATTRAQLINHISGLLDKVTI